MEQSLSNLKFEPGSRKERKRIGRGHGSGQGKTAGRGMKGQKAREQVARGFEGGQNPLQRRLPQLRGKSKKARNIGIFQREYAIVNVGTLDRFEADTLVDPEVLLARRIVRDLKDGLKILGEGEITRPLTVRAHAFSEAARTKIEAAGGRAEVIS